jgi:hypothetical protein
LTGAAPRSFEFDHGERVVSEERGEVLIIEGSDIAHENIIA